MIYILKKKKLELLYFDKIFFEINCESVSCLTKAAAFMQETSTQCLRASLDCVLNLPYKHTALHGIWATWVVFGAVSL